MPKIFIITGEASGDALGAKLMAALKSELQHSPPPSSDGLQFHGIGGERMQAQEMQSIFPMEELSLIGFVEILPHIPNIFRRINQTVEEIIQLQPDVVVTIDAPAFCNRVARKIRKYEEANSIAAENRLKLIHYVAPTVWAYKPKRAEKIAKIYDHLMVLLPFEPPYFERVGLPCTFIGHPIVEEDMAGGDGTEFRKQNNIATNAPVLALMPGSRSGELKRLLPIFADTVKILAGTIPELSVVILSTRRFEQKLQDETADWPVKAIVVSDKTQKKHALAASDAALVKSGTGSLEVAIASVPMVVAYKVNGFSAWLLKRMIKVNYVNLANIILDKEVIPELLQEQCTAKNLSEKLQELLENKIARQSQLSQTTPALEQLSHPDITPSIKAAQTVLQLSSTIK